jgi:hypothetical protein
MYELYHWDNNNLRVELAYRRALLSTPTRNRYKGRVSKRALRRRVAEDSFAES